MSNETRFRLLKDLVEAKPILRNRLAVKEIQEDGCTRWEVVMANGEAIVVDVSGHIRRVTNNKGQVVANLRITDSYDRLDGVYLKELDERIKDLRDNETKKRRRWKEKQSV